MGAEQLKPSLTRAPGKDHGKENRHERILSLDHNRCSDWHRCVDVLTAVSSAEPQVNFSIVPVLRSRASIVHIGARVCSGIRYG